MKTKSRKKSKTSIERPTEGSKPSTMGSAMAM